MLLWAANENEKSMWVQAFRDCNVFYNKNVAGMLPEGANGQDEEEKVPVLLLKDDNEFIVTLLKCLVPSKDKQGKSIA